MAKAKKAAGGASTVIRDAIREKWGKPAAVALSDAANYSEVREAIPTGIEALDHYIFGCGGFPIGKMVEVYGPEGCGKTSLALAACARAQQLGGVAIYADTEHAVQIERARVFGVDLDSLIFLQPENTEDTCNQLADSLRAIPEGAGPVIVVWDSLASVGVKGEMEGPMGKANFGNAKILNQACRVLNPLMGKRRVSLVFINQVREKIGVAFGDPTTTPGGAGPKFFATVRLQMWGGAKVKRGEAIIGQDVLVKSAKHRLTIPGRKLHMRLNYTTGWDNNWTTLEHAKKLELVGKASRDVAAARELLVAGNWVTVPPECKETEEALGGEED